MMQVLVSRNTKCVLEAYLLTLCTPVPHPLMVWIGSAWKLQRLAKQSWNKAVHQMPTHVVLPLARRALPGKGHSWQRRPEDKLGHRIQNLKLDTIYWYNKRFWRSCIPHGLKLKFLFRDFFRQCLTALVRHIVLLDYADIRQAPHTEFKSCFSGFLVISKYFLCDSDWWVWTKSHSISIPINCQVSCSGTIWGCSASSPASPCIMKAGWIGREAS